MTLTDIVLLSTTFLFVHAGRTDSPQKPLDTPSCGGQTCDNCYNEYAWKVDYPPHQRTYGVYTPADWTNSTQWPLIFDFHGSGGSSAGQYCNSQYYLHPQGQEYVVIYPQGLKYDWYGPPYASEHSINDTKFVQDLLNFATSEYNIDKTRIYASGKSAGAGFVNTLACSDIADSFSAFAMASAALYTDSSATCSGLTPSPSCSDAPCPTSTVAPNPPTNPDCCTNVWNKAALTCQPRNVLEVHGWSDPTIFYEWSPPYCNCGRCHAGTRFDDAFLPQISDWAYNWAIRNGVSDPTPIQNNETDILFNYTGSATVNHYRIGNLAHCWPQTTTQYDTYPNTDSMRSSCGPTWMDFTDVVIRFFENPANPPPSKLQEDEFKKEL